MSVLSKKYNIPAETVTKMIKDGVISCSWSNYEEVYELYKKGMSTSEISFHTKMSERNVRYVLSKLK